MTAPTAEKIPLPEDVPMARAVVDALPNPLIVIDDARLGRTVSIA